ncbi:MAG TPA: hypothetical protein VK970_14145 [Candidatus Methylacidiphilales bacterium]|nr:hypothetical protein [Candidatus Methylacidiphilales bacterium]
MLIDHFKRNNRLQNGVPSPICYRHSTRAKLDWEAVFAHFYVEMGVSKRTFRYAGVLAILVQRKA